MPARLTYEEVYEYIHSKGCELLSKVYNTSKEKLHIKCGVCHKEYMHSFNKFKEGLLHPYCQNEEKKPFGGYTHPIILIAIPCTMCNKEFKPKYANKKFCSRECYIEYPAPLKLSPIKCPICKNDFQPKYSARKMCSRECSKKMCLLPDYLIIAKNSGKKSAALQEKRSKNEIYFSELCSDYFEITTNEPFFEGWDADVIIHSEKIAVLWNGIWHYKQISKTQSLQQVQSRDKIKMDVIEKMGYTPYIIKDMGKYNKKFVEQEFEIFMLMRMKCG